MKIILKDNTELEAIKVDGTNVYTQGQSRDALKFHFSKDNSFDELNAIFADEEKTKTIKIVGDESEPSVYAHDNYIIKANAELKPVVITPATADTEEVTEDRIVITMAQISFAEKQLKELKEDSASLFDAVDFLLTEATVEEPVVSTEETPVEGSIEENQSEEVITDSVEEIPTESSVETSTEESINPEESDDSVTQETSTV